jgi:enterochelin esterase-like enzyme
MDALWNTPIIDGPLPWIVNVLAVVLAVVLLLRRPRARTVVRFVVWIAGGAALGAALFFGANALDVFGVELPDGVLVWAIVTFAALGLALASLFRVRPWRRVVALVAVPVFAAAGALGINAVFGVDPTLGSLFGIVPDRTLALPPSETDSTAGPPLYASWSAPAGMPATGERGTEDIPGTVSGFDARPAGIYLPPAAQVPDAPALPLVVMMMGYPGTPDPTAISDVLDTFAAQHEGLAPIVIVADQLGGSGDDPACADSDLHGKAETYITVDVVAWARAHLNVVDDPGSWVIAGFSNGGGCAVKYGAQHPETFRNILDVSGEEFPGSEDESTVVAQVYGGDQAAFDAARPISILQRGAGGYAGVTAVFTAGGDDPTFSAAAQKVSAAAQAAGMATTLSIIPGAGHDGAALDGGLTDGFTVLYPVLGLAPPAG